MTHGARGRGFWATPTTRLLAALIPLAAAAASDFRADVQPPLDNEAIVRLVMTGTSEEAILQAIAERPVDFDLSPEVVAELRQAGIGDRILEAMRRRQAAMPRSEAPARPGPQGAAPGPAPGAVQILFDAPPDDRRGTEAPAIAIRRLPRGARRPGGMEVAEVSDLALAILCITPDHVPDHWDARTPLTEGPRHELILFRPGSTTARQKGLEILLLNRETPDPAPIGAGHHTLLLGLAGKQSGSGSWRLLAADRARVEVLPGGNTRITLRAGGRIRGSLMTGLSVDQEWQVVSIDPGAGPAARPREGPSDAGARG